MGSVGESVGVVVGSTKGRWRHMGSADAALGTCVGSMVRNGVTRTELQSGGCWRRSSSVVCQVGFLGGSNMGGTWFD
jgi:hypothetical protein